MDSSANGFYEFGPFRLDAKERFLLRDGQVLTLTPKAFDTLLLLVENSRHVLTKEELMRRLWPDTFVEEANLTNNISILRRVLGETHNGELYIQTVPRVGYRFVRTVTCDGSAREVEGDGRSAATSVNQPESAAAPPPESLGRARQEARASFRKTGVENLDEQAIRTSPLPSARLTSSAKYLISAIKRRKRGALLALATLVLAAASGAYIAYLIYQRPKINERPTQYSLARLTFDPGLQTEPTWSPDGRFIAYTSDHSGNFDIWVQPVVGGAAVQVTHSPAHDWQPDWSPDDSQIVFRSERDGGGLFVVPALGGHDRKISSFGYHPRWSPDGKEILLSNISGPGLGPKVYVVSLEGNPPQEVQPELLADFVSLRSAVWHPDGQRISLLGERKTGGFGHWTVPVGGGVPVKSEMSAEVERQFKEVGFNNSFNLRWAPSGRAVYFEGLSREARSLWKFIVDPQTLRYVAGPERLTTGSYDTDIALSPDGKRLAFAARTENTRAWLLPFDPRSGKLKGEGRPVTPPGVNPRGLNLSRDGKRLLYIAGHAGTNKFQLREKSLDQNRETLVSEDIPNSVCWSRDGTRMAYGAWRPNLNREENLTLVLSAAGGDEQVIGSEALIFDWSADGQWLLVNSDHDSPRHWGVVGLYPLSAAPHAETQIRIITSHPEYNLFQARFSPDDRWVCFNAVKAANVSTIYVVPSSGGQWTRITEDNLVSDKPHWSPDGHTIYYISNRVTGFYNVWGIRFDPEAGKPVGEPFRVTSFDSPKRMLWSDFSRTEITLSAERLVLPITEATGNIWLLDGVDR